MALAAVMPAAARAGAAAAPAAGALAAVQAVLDIRAEAVLGQDRAAFLATVDPEAPADFVAAQRRHFDGLASLPLASFSLRAHLEDSGDLSVAAAGRYGSAPVFLPETRQHYRFEGYDGTDAVDYLWLTFVERDGRWYVGGDGDLAALGLDSDRGMWDLGPVRIAAGPHFLVLSDPADAARADALAALAERAATRMAGLWDQPWSGRVPLVLPPSVAALERLLQSTVDLDKFVAFASYSLSDDDGSRYSATAPRIFVQDDRLSRHSEASQIETLVHELVHAAAAPLAGPFVPLWVHEGVADWAATGRPGDVAAPSGSDGVLPRPYELTTGSAALIQRSYRESRSAISYLAERAGPGAPSALFRGLGEARTGPGSVDHHVDAALRRVTGSGLAEFERAWAADR
ncbi:MAG: hypothetical protein ACRD1K_10425 [Acidimicrobiales bacterium]